MNSQTFTPGSVVDVLRYGKWENATFVGIDKKGQYVIRLVTKTGFARHLHIKSGNLRFPLNSPAIIDNKL
jgi:hypothetical protein